MAGNWRRIPGRLQGRGFDSSILRQTRGHITVLSAPEERVMVVRLHPKGPSFVRHQRYRSSWMCWFFMTHEEFLLRKIFRK
jgi:hypothetical protein